MSTKQFKENDKLKTKLEQPFIRELKSFFARINKENAQNIVAKNQPINADKYKPELEALLRKHYIRVQDSFSGNIEQTLPIKDQGLSDKENETLIQALISWRDKKAVSSSILITDTTNKQITRSIELAREIEAEKEEATNNKNLALTTSGILKKSFVSRPETISETETQSAAESTRFAEASVLSGVDSFIQIGIDQSTKMWVTVGDNHVRPAHRNVAGIENTLNEAFLVDDEFMRTPGDAGLGASAKNLAHCRCSLTYNIVRNRK